MALSEVCVHDDISPLLAGVAYSIAELVELPTVYSRPDHAKAMPVCIPLPAERAAVVVLNVPSVPSLLIWA